MGRRPKYPIEILIKAYEETGNIWKAGKKLDTPGQNVWKRLRVAGYKLRKHGGKRRGEETREGTANE